MTVRNRLGITKKAIEALERHSTISHDIYLFDNSTNFRIREHFEFAYNLYKHGLIAQYTFNTQNSTFNAFSKAVACNQFGQHHMMDPKWKTYEFMTIIDNDIIVMPGWDHIIKTAWNDVKKYNMDKEVRIIGQSPGGIKGKIVSGKKFANLDARLGKLGGSGFWNVQPNFFRDVGFLDITKLVGYDKRHDQSYWNLLEKVNKGKPYILGLNTRLCVHCGSLAGSICNRLSRHRGQKNKLDQIKFEDADKKIENMSFDEFYKYINKNETMSKDW